MARQTQTINLDMKPQKNPPRFSVTEYDKGADGWFLRLRLFQDGEPFIPDSGTTVKIEGTTPGGTGFTASATLVSNDNMVTFTLTEDMTAYKGSAWCKLILTKSGSVTGASGFWLDCDRAGVEAETVIGAPGFQEQINQGVYNWLDGHEPFFSLPENGQLGQVLLSDGADGAYWGDAQSGGGSIEIRFTGDEYELAFAGEGGSSDPTEAINAINAI